MTDLILENSTPQDKQCHLSSTPMARPDGSFALPDAKNQPYDRQGAGYWTTKNASPQKRL